MAASNCFDVLVRGDGVVARSLALSLARSALRVGLLAPAPGTPRAPDLRAYALNLASRRLLRDLRVWDALPADAVTPISAMQVQGDGAGQIHFSAYRQCVEALGWIVDAAALDDALADAVRFAPGVIAAGPGDGAALVAVCEGKDSGWRADHGVPWMRHGYGHSAIAARLLARTPHRGVARQWFRSPDVLALLPTDRPRPGNGLALVWSAPDAQVDALMGMEETAFEQALTSACGLSGDELKLVSARARWPLALARAERWCGPGWVLLGDAAHTVHPLAGQGLNLGLADVASLVEVLVGGREAWRSPGDERLLRRYARRRTVPTWAMAQMTDGLLHLFAAQPAPVKELRNRGLDLFNLVTPVKRWLTRRALDA